MKEKSSARHSNPKHARNGRHEESSVQQLRENHETIQRLSSQLQKMQEQMNSMNDSGRFQEVESNHSGKLSHISSQPAMIPSGKRLPLDTCKQSDYRKTFLVIIFHIDSSRNHPQGIHSCAPQRERGSVPQAAGSETLFPRDDNSIQKSSLYLSDFPSEAMLWIKGVEMVGSIEEFAINCWQ